MSEIRRLLEERGNERLRAFFEIASESGIRKSEICRLRLENVAINTQTLKVCLPHKTMRERRAFFSGRASVRIREWLAVRKQDCGHQFLFHNYLGGSAAQEHDKRGVQARSLQVDSRSCLERHRSRIDREQARTLLHTR